MVEVALCGMGYWGRNLARILSNHPGMRLACVVDPKFAASPAPRIGGAPVPAFADLGEALAAVAVDAVVVATPVSSHHGLAAAAIAAGKHVMVEKPMCRTSDEAADLVRRAEAAGVTLMVDHTFLFHPAVERLKALEAAGALGRVSYYDSQRINLGLFQPDVNVLWDLAPHDLSIVDHLLEAEPVEVEASGHCHVNPASPDIAYVTLHYPGAIVAHLNLSWMSPVKVRRVAVGGSERMVVWNDLDRDEPLKLYDTGITVLPEGKRDIILPTYRVGSVTSPRLPNAEPLTDAVEHFRRVILGEERCRSDGRTGLRIVRTLEWAQSALDDSLRRVGARSGRTHLAVAAE